MISSGGLRAPDDSSQSPKSMWKSMAALNQMGMITIDSQPGDGLTERAYIDGFMMEEHALRYVEALNCGGGMVAVLLRPAARWMQSSIAVTRVLRSGDSETRIPLYMDPSQYKHLKTGFSGGQGAAGLDASTKAVLVCSFDPKWGRHATSRTGLIQQMNRAMEKSLL